MQTKRRELFTTVRTEGAILPADLLQRVAEGDADLQGLRPEDYHLSGEKVNEAISRAWNRLLGAWQALQTARQPMADDEPATSVTREKWLLPLFRELDYGRLPTAKAVEIEGKSYAISHMWEHVPIHLLGWGIDLDHRTPGVAGAATASPHSMVQEFLNRSEAHLWAFLSNGRTLRILRDNVSLTRQAYVEFDLEAMMNGEVYADFALLWLLCHQSRVEAVGSRESAVGKDEEAVIPTPDSRLPTPTPTNCWLEKWSQAAHDRGTRALDSLRQGVEEAITALGRGFLLHPNNAGLRDKLYSGTLTAQDYYRQLLRMVYRLLFLFVAEDRGLLLDPNAEDNARNRYTRYYSTARLRRLAERQRGTRHSDLYHALLLVMNRLGQTHGCPQLALPALGSFLWSPQSMPDLEGSGESGVGSTEAKPDSRLPIPDSPSSLANKDLLRAVRELAFTVDAKVLRAVDYKNLGAEELGSIYESLLELHPRINQDAGTFELGTAAGHERKTTGSYYTPTSLITCLLDSALDPVLDEAVKGGAGNRESGVGNRGKRSPDPSQPPTPDSPRPTPSLSPTPHSLLPTPSPESAEGRILALKVCDPACGSGHFLIAAAHRIGKRLAAVRTGDDEPAPDALRHAVRDVIGHCIFGVDVNPMAVELCKINLWLESLEPGKPLSFLDHHIQCGNSLLGATPALLKKGIPDEAFKPIEGDDKKVCNEMKRLNRDERAKQGKLFDYAGAPTDRPWERMGDFAASLAQLDTGDDETVADVRSKQERYENLVASSGYLFGRLWADAWCAAFVWKKTQPPSYSPDSLLPTPDSPPQAFDYGITESIFRRIERNPHDCPPWMREEIERLAKQYRFFHWHLAFPQVFRVPPEGEEPENARAAWSGGFNLVLGNPPWERVKLQQKEWFAERSPEIAAAPNAAVRKRMIEALKITNPTLYQSFLGDSRKAEGESHLLRNTDRYPLCGHGDINLYTVFAEGVRSFIGPLGRVGCIVPSGIATDDTTRFFFQDIVKQRSLVSLLDFENRDAIFQGVHRSYKFCLLTLTSTARPHEQATFSFFSHNVRDVFDPARQFTLTANDIELLNPNTLTCPVFRSRRDAEIARMVYRRNPVLIRRSPDNTDDNVWSLSFLRMFDITNDAELFRTPEELAKESWEATDGCFSQKGAFRVPLFEGRLGHQFNHRFASEVAGNITPASCQDLGNPFFRIHTKFTVPLQEAEGRLARRRLEGTSGLLGLRRITRNTDVRTAIAAILPYRAVSYGWLLNLGPTAQQSLLLLCTYNSFAFDYLLRNCMTQAAIPQGTLEQVAVPDKDGFTTQHQHWIHARSLELSYTAWDLEPFAQDCGYDGPPFRWHEERRFLLRCELDAAYFHLYLGPPAEWGTDNSELRAMFPTPRDAVEHIMETFPIVKHRDEQQHGEYRTKRVILEIYDAMQKAIDTGQPYQTLLDPPPGPPAEGLPDWQPGQPKPATWPPHIHPPRAAGGSGESGMGSREKRPASRCPDLSTPSSSPIPDSLLPTPFPWQMTRAQYQAHCESQGRNDITENNRLYWREVQAAIQSGKPVPQEVRTEYEQLKGMK